MSVESKSVISALIAALACGCASQDIPQAYRGRLFERVSPLGAYTGKTGFTGPVLGPGSYTASTNGEIHKVECATVTAREALTPLTKDGVPLALSVYVRFHADCTDYGVERLLDALPVDESNSVSAARIFQVYIQPEVGEAVRQVFAPVRAREVFDNRVALLEDVRNRLLKMIAARDKYLVVLRDVNLSDLTFPPDVERANMELAVQAARRDTATAERDRVAAEIELAEMRLEQKTGARPAQQPAAKGAQPAADRPGTTNETTDTTPAADDNPYN
jgi:regulator of protease activity HflC (stomatin/prohibitin superfamily)